MGDLDPGSFRKNWEKLVFFPLPKRLTVIDLFEGLWLVGTSASPRLLTTVPAMPSSSTVRGGQYDTKCVPFE